MKKNRSFIITSAILITMIFSYSPAEKTTFITENETAANQLEPGEGLNTGTSEPTSGDRRKAGTKVSPKLVVIDPGHGGIDGGTSSEKLVEKDVVLDVCLRLNTILKKLDIPTYMTRSDDSFLEVKDRINIANNNNASLFISVHCNWFKSSKYSGTIVFYNPSETLHAGNLTEINYAALVHDELAKTLKTNDRGTVPNKDLYVLNNAKMPSILVELGFLSNPGDEALLASGDFRQTAAQAMADGIVKALNCID